MKFRKFLLISFAILLLSLIIGSVIGAVSEIPISPEITEVDFLPIFSHNLILSLILVITGTLSFSLGSHAILLFNGVTTGYILTKLWSFPNKSELYWHIIPHGFLELVAYVLFTATSLYISYNLFLIVRNRLRKTNTLLPASGHFIRISGLSMICGLAILLLAALVEVYIV